MIGHHRTAAIRRAVWLYYRFCLSYRDVGDLLAERGINVSYETVRRFKSMGQAPRFLAVHGTMKNLFAIPRHLMRAKHYRLFRTEAFDMYQQVTCA